MRLMKLGVATRLLKQTFAEWQKDKVPLLASSLAYYTVFSIAPLLLIAITIAGFFFGEEAVRGELIGQIQGLIGKDGAVLKRDAPTDTPASMAKDIEAALAA